MIYLIVMLVISIGTIVFYGQKNLKIQEEFYENIIAMLGEANTLQVHNLNLHMKKFAICQKSLSEEITPLYDLVNTHAHIDIYLSELREENTKLKKILKRKQNAKRTQ